jgi:cytochrome c peroxidase
MGPRWLVAAAVFAAGLAVARPGAGSPTQAMPQNAASEPADRAKVELGRRLFYDADLSDDGTMACATCHEQHRGFADGNRNHAGVHGDPARRNVPGLANLAWLPNYTWGDPRIRTLEAQVLVPVLGTSPVEMGMKGREAEIATRLGHDACYHQMFAAAFPETHGRIDLPAVTQALASFERTLVSVDAPYDRMRSGRETADPTVRAGAALFDRDCASCHSGPVLSDGKFHRITEWTAADRGLGETTGKASDDGRFRTPSLRNVAVTQPYFHDGSANTLRIAIERHPGVRSDAEIAALVALLETMTDRQFLVDPRFSLPGEACGRRL